MLALDTYTYVKKLTDAGISERAASVHAEAFYALAESGFAKKQDLGKMETELKADISVLDSKVDRLETELKADISALGAKVDSLESRIDAKINKMALTVTAFLGVLMTIYKFVHF